MIFYLYFNILKWSINILNDLNDFNNKKIFLIKDYTLWKLIELALSGLPNEKI